MSTDVRNNSVDRDWVESLRATLTNQLQEQTARLTQLTADTGDPADTHSQSALIAATRQGIDQINDALRRIDEGSYGSCGKCGQPIPRERLEILPHARFCVPCQQKHGK